MAEIWEGSPLQYDALASDIFPRLGGQSIVPFLGAGASLPPALAPVTTAPAGFPSKAQIEIVLQELGFRGSEYKRERTIVQFALALAYLMIQGQSHQNPTPADLLQDLVNNPYPPSAGKLVEFFARLSGYAAIQQGVAALMEHWPVDWNEPGQEIKRQEWIDDLQQCFKLLIDAAQLWSAHDTLTSIAAHYETLRGRKNLWQELAHIFQDKKATTKMHNLVAQAAEHHLARVTPQEVAELHESHYLIVTTNYDCLIEEALGDLPWVVLYSRRTRPIQSNRASIEQDSADGPQDTGPHVLARFSPPMIKRYPNLIARHKGKSPKEFYLDVDKPMVVIFKVHGCLFRENKFEDDSVIITDFDYEDYIANMGQAAKLVVPTAAGLLMHGRSFLFLGYSLSDWNIRTIMTALMRKRAEGESGRDYAVMKGISKSAEAYCTRRNITIIRTDLEDFGQEIQKRKPTPPLQAAV